MSVLLFSKGDGIWWLSLYLFQPHSWSQTKGHLNSLQAEWGSAYTQTARCTMSPSTRSRRCPSPRLYEQLFVWRGLTAPLPPSAAQHGRAGPVRRPERPAERQRVRSAAHTNQPSQGQHAAHSCGTQPGQLLASHSAPQQGDGEQAHSDTRTYTETFLQLKPDVELLYLVKLQRKLEKVNFPTQYLFILKAVLQHNEGWYFTNKQYMQTPVTRW